MSDLSRLFLPNPDGPAQPAQFRQAVLTAFDPNTGENTVLIGTTVVPNLPLLVTGAEIGLEAGDNILVMYLGNSAMIVGKITSPGGQNYGLGNAGHFSALFSGSNFGASAAGVTISSGTMAIPEWAKSARVIVYGQASLHNNSGALDNLSSQVRVDDLSSGSFAFSAFTPVAVTNTFVGATYAALLDVIAATAGDVLTFTYTAFAGGTWPADAGAVGSMFALADFYRQLPPDLL